MPENENKLIFLNYKIIYEMLLDSQKYALSNDIEASNAILNCIQKYIKIHIEQSK